MKPKAQTMAQKFGFMDPDLATPQHDAIMLWLDGALTKAFAEKTFGNHPNYEWKYVDDDREPIVELFQLMKDGKVVIDPSTPVQTMTSKMWEVPILDRSYTIGFADMRVIYADHRLRARTILNAMRQQDSGSQAIPFHITEGVPDFDYARKTRYFEVKPSIPSLGEVIRQVRMYQTYTAGAEWWIVSPDATFKEQIESQGIKFLVVPSSI